MKKGLFSHEVSTCDDEISGAPSGGAQEARFFKVYTSLELLIWDAL